MQPLLMNRTLIKVPSTLYGLRTPHVSTRSLYSSCYSLSTLDYAQDQLHNLWN